jgi:2-polyprenyl-3-methyl-5-hydroxy-6-metoxy-1,4-benzoquinol methylase
MKGVDRMEKYVGQNKSAWEYNAYDFWVMHQGTPAERAKEIRENPRGMLKKYSRYFGDVTGVKIAVICGSCGAKAVPLAMLGASVTVFDLSKENARYATETAEASGVKINYVVGDVLGVDMSVYGGYFDIVFMEGGILHYFHDLKRFMDVMYGLLKNGGRMLCSDFHPIHRLIDVLELNGQKEKLFDISGSDYFDSEIRDGEMPHAKFYDDEKRRDFPKCSVRGYTLSDIINAAVGSRFVIAGFDEHPAWTNPKLPGEFTLLADKV